ncbi:MAG TPA: DNA polymerase III subunit epsilon [Acidiferrobacterales bacterium]|jgi:DNA polymerase-3 subunit epsilon
MRQIVLDTETTGLEPSQGHRIIEIGAVEMVNRRLTGNRFQQYLNPDREIDAGAIEVHGITDEMLADKPRFADIAEDFLAFVGDAELIIHNAPFDVGFINQELKLTGAALADIASRCAVLDTLKLARSQHPGQKNDLDSLCRRYSIDNSQRTLHGALLDAEILADVYLAMTGGQTALFQEAGDSARPGTPAPSAVRRLDAERAPLPVLHANEAELAAHAAWLEEIDKKSGGRCVWKRLAADSAG